MYAVFPCKLKLRFVDVYSPHEDFEYSSSLFAPTAMSMAEDTKNSYYILQKQKKHPKARRLA